MQTPESQSQAPPPAAEPNKHWGQAISATQRQPLQYQSQPPLSYCTPQAWQVFSWAAATVIWKVNNLHVTWLDRSFRHPHACYDLQTPTSATRLLEIPGTDSQIGNWNEKEWEYISYVLSSCSVTKELRPKVGERESDGGCWRWEWEERFQQEVSYLTQENLIWVLSA